MSIWTGKKKVHGNEYFYLVSDIITDTVTFWIHNLATSWQYSVWKRKTNQQDSDLLLLYSSFCSWLKQEARIA